MVNPVYSLELIYHSRWSIAEKIRIFSDTLPVRICDRDGQVDTLCSTLERNKTGLVMKALKERGVAEMTVLGHWWCKGLFLGGKASLYQSETEQAVNSLRKGSKVWYSTVNMLRRLGRPPLVAQSSSTEQ